MTVMELREQDKMHRVLFFALTVVLVCFSGTLSCNVPASDDFLPGVLLRDPSSERNWDEFQKALTWYAEKEKPVRLYIPRESNEEQELAAYFFAKEEAKYEELLNSLKELQEQFCIFSGKLAEVIATQGEGHYKDFLYSKTYANVISWYISFIEQNLFQDGWRSAYNAYTKQGRGDQR